MTLKSQRFAGDQKLEAAATADQAHIVRGASGAHVTKIQSALIELDGAAISGREIELALYGSSTASTVLAFKTKRRIVNRTYQTQADDIVGKMTIIALDLEMLAKEGMPSRAVRLEPITPQRRLRQARQAPVAPRRLALNFALSPTVQAPRPGFDNVAIDIPVFGLGSFRVVNGVGGILSCDPNIAAIFDPLQFTASNFVPVTKNPQVFNVRGLNPGLTIITFQKPFASLLSMPQPIVVIVRSTKTSRRRPEEFVKGDEHNHHPSKKWSEISKSPRNTGFGDNEGGVADGGIFRAQVLTLICFGCSTPKCVVENVISLGFGNLPIAKTHIDFYLRGGGRDFNEDTNIAIWIRSDHGIRLALQREVNGINDKSGKKRGHFEFLQSEFQNSDFQNAFGSIDRVDFELDFDLDECTVWFQDRYEWHPVYQGLYDLKNGDEARHTNCVHAAFVEMQLEGARDYWMKGEATVPMEDIFR